MSWSKRLSYIPEPVANSPQAQPWVNQAREAVNANQSELHAFLSQRVDLASRVGTASGRELERFEHCLDIVTGRCTFFNARPLMLLSPLLPAFSFIARVDYLLVLAVEAHLPTMRAAVQGELGSEVGLDRVACWERKCR